MFLFLKQILKIQERMFMTVISRGGVKNEKAATTGYFKETLEQFPAVLMTIRTIFFFFFFYGKM